MLALVWRRKASDPSVGVFLLLFAFFSADISLANFVWGAGEGGEDCGEVTKVTVVQSEAKECGLQTVQTTESVHPLSRFLHTPASF